MKKVTKKVEWDSKLDKRIAELKKQSLENGNFHIFIATTKEVKKGTQLSALMVSRDINILQAADSYLKQLPNEVVEAVLLKRLIS